MCWRWQAKGPSVKLQGRLPNSCPITLGPEGNYSTSSAWSSATPTCASPDSSGFVSSDAVVAERGAAFRAPVHGRTTAAGAHLSVFLIG